jgi:hypothetical protein
MKSTIDHRMKCHKSPQFKNQVKQETKCFWSAIESTLSKYISLPEVIIRISRKQAPELRWLWSPRPLSTLLLPLLPLLAIIISSKLLHKLLLALYGICTRFFLR